MKTTKKVAGIGRNQMTALSLASHGGVSVEELSVELGCEDLPRMGRTLAILQRRGLLDAKGRLTKAGTERLSVEAR
jgi:hypothetical protein